LGADEDLLDATERGDIDEVRKLLDEGANPNSKGYFRSTPLHNATKRENREVVQLLLEKRADPNAEDHRKWIPLHYAAVAGYDEIVQLLLDRDNIPGNTKIGDPKQVSWYEIE